MASTAVKSCIALLCLLVTVTSCLGERNTTSADGTMLVCYFTATSYFPASKVPAKLCTHIIYAFGMVTPAGIAPQSQADLNNYKTLINLKKQNPGLKVMLSLQQGFDSVVDLGTLAMKTFSVAAAKSLTMYGFDGVDLDWEFPKASQKEDYKQFIQILHAETSKNNLLLSAAIPNGPYWFQGYDADTLAKYMDFMTAMTYDFHLYSSRDNTTGYNSPLFSPPGESKLLSTTGMLNYYLGLGVPANKLLMGVPLYGRSWTLADPSKHDLHSPAVGKGAPSPYRHLRGIYLYPDVCVAQAQGAKSYQDQKNGASYLYSNSTWVAFESKQTVPLKVQWMKSNNLAGVGVWAMHLDDIDGVCTAAPLPLLSAIRLALD